MKINRKIIKIIGGNGDVEALVSKKGIFPTKFDELVKSPI